MKQHIAAALLGTRLATSAGAGQGTEDGEWRSYSGDVWGTKYAPLDQITGDNCGELERAWRWRLACRRERETVRSSCGHLSVSFVSTPRCVPPDMR